MAEVDRVSRTAGERDTGAVSAASVAAVIVTYGPDGDFPTRLARTTAQVGHVVLVDNHSPWHAREMLRSSTSARVELIENSRNLGIGTALNQGLRRAEALGYSWVLTLDQDSEVDSDLVASLGGLYDSCPFGETVGLLNANARSRHSGQIAVRCASSAQRFLEAKAAITSGSALSIAAYAAAGPFRDDFFIEGVDLEYCLRLRRHGFRILVSCRPLMTHAAGKMEERRFGRRIVVVPNHEPWRYYYVTRNLLRIFAAYFFYEPMWVVAALINLGKTLVKMVVFEDRRLAKLACVTIGVWDAMIGSRRNRFLPSDS
ncbi:MAG TPA: glycosyltransferase [bacterium]|nr:glycosyltransferase [bacterium]